MNRNICIITTIVCLALPGASWGRYHNEYEPAGTPVAQYANISPLPGGTVAIDQDGKPDGLGAMQINLPVAYTPGWGNILGSGYKGAHINRSDTEFGNGSGVFGMGFFGGPKVWISAMQVSENLDESKAVSAQLSVFGEKANRPALAIGRQDMLGKEPNGMSTYAVLTKSFRPGGQHVYASLGYGNGRFLDTFFYAVSLPLGESVNVAAEYDGFQYNFGAGWRPGGRYGKVTLFGGHNSHAGYVAGMAVVGTFR